MGLGDADQMFTQRLFYGRTHFRCGYAEPEFSAFGIMLQETIAGQNTQQAAYGRFMKPKPCTNLRGAHFTVMWNKGQEDLQRLLHRMIIIGFWEIRHSSLEICKNSCIIHNNVLYFYNIGAYPCQVFLLPLSIEEPEMKKILKAYRYYRIGRGLP